MTTKGHGGTVKEKQCGRVIGGGHRRKKELRQRKRCAQLLPVGAAAALAAATLSARADVLSEMQRFWDGAAVNTTGPTAFEGQASGHWTLGNLYLRAPVQSERIGTVSLPSFRAGCGGIDAFAGCLFVHRLRPARGLRPRHRPERDGVRVRSGTGNHLTRHRRDDEQAPGAGPVGQQPEHQFLRDGAVPGRGRLVHQRPGECIDLRGHRDVPGDFFGLRGGSARLRVGWEKIFHVGSGDGRAG